jgi:hypothetical protein
MLDGPFVGLAFFKGFKFSMAVTMKNNVLGVYDAI